MCTPSGPPARLPGGRTQVIRHFAEVARHESRAGGIRAALHAGIDLATEPRWARQLPTFGDDPASTGRTVVAYLDGLQGSTLGRSRWPA